MKSSRFSSLPTRLAVALVAIPVIVWAAMAGSYFFFALVAVISAVSLHEFYVLAETKGAFPQKAVGIAGGFLVNAAFIYERLQVEVFSFFASRGFPLSMFSQLQFLLVTLLVFLLVVLLIELFRQKGSPMMNAGATVFGVMVVSLFFGTLIEIRELFPFGFPVSKFFSVAMAGDLELATISRWGGYTIVSLLASIWICDTAAYFGGLTFGRHRLFERVSPKKSWEGAVFGFVGAVLAMLAARALVLDYLRLQDALILGVIVGIFGQLGDLVESRFKRDANVKDSSALIPGHGGVYDRFDSLVFVAPIVYLYIDFVVLS
ncbi:MAG: phosphatidate cytidylyltransferase [Ignavibacteriales bacterium]|nr:phosphatidate cytidylyltransferase [Ignavibacteriales bacterium]